MSEQTTQSSKGITLRPQPYASKSNCPPSKIPHFVLNEATGRYKARRTLSSDQIIKSALKLLGGSVNNSEVLASPQHTREYVTLALGAREHEVFACMWLNNRHQVIEFEELFYGTIDGASIYPREVVKRALNHNAAAVIVVHNHPSGEPEPSPSDVDITSRLKEALSLVGVRLIDHMIVGGDGVISMAERGMV